MEKLSCQGHRKRIRAVYLTNGIKGTPDHNVLELFLSLVIPQKDVKPLAYDLINTFGSFERVFSADPDELMEVNGVGENTAVLLSLVKDINARILLNKNENINSLISSKDSVEYVENILKSSQTEQVLVITLDNRCCVINSSIVSAGTVNCANVSFNEIVRCATRDKASYVILAHNHPNGNAKPSTEDLNTTRELANILTSLNIKLRDHVIVGKNESLSLVSDVDYALYLFS